MKFFREIFLGEEKIFTLNVIIFHAALILISFLFVWLFSHSTSFRYSLLGGDSAIFQVIGKYWTQGYLPYVELFDHKGPLLFFINALGYMIYPRVGIMVPQIICLYLSCLFIWRAMELYSSSAWKIFFLIFTLIYYAAHYEEGNHVSEYSVVFLSAVAYCFLRALKDSENKKFFHPPLYGFIYGLGFGACVLIRTSDALQICCQTFLATIFLLQAREFKNLWQNFLSFCAGFAVIILPFVIYFAAHDALYEMFYGTVLFNLKYSGENTLYYAHSFKTRLIYFSIHLIPFFITIIISSFALKQNPKSRLLSSGIFIGAMIVFMLISLRPSDQYAMIFLANAPIFFAVLHESSDTLQRIWQTRSFSFKRVLIKFLIFLFVIHVFILMFYVKSVALSEKTALSMFFTAYNKRAELLNSDEHEKILKLRALIPDKEKESFACWANFCTGAHWILQADMKPRERFFANNRLLSRVDSQIREEYFGNLRRDYPLWILYGVHPKRKSGEPPRTFEEDSELEQLLAEKYSLKGEVYIFPQVLKLYRLNE